MCFYFNVEIFFKIKFFSYFFTSFINNLEIEALNMLCQGSSSSLKYSVFLLKKAISIWDFLLDQALLW